MMSSSINNQSASTLPPNKQLQPTRPQFFIRDLWTKINNKKQLEDKLFAIIVDARVSPVSTYLAWTNDEKVVQKPCATFASWRHLSRRPRDLATPFAHRQRLRAAPRSAVRVEVGIGGSWAPVYIRRRIDRCCYLFNLKTYFHSFYVVRMGL